MADKPEKKEEKPKEEKKPSRLNDPGELINRLGFPGMGRKK